MIRYLRSSLTSRSLALIISVFILAISLSLQLGSDNISAAYLAPLAKWTFEGHVYDTGPNEDPAGAQPLENAVVAVYGANDPHPDPGQLIDETTTDSEGRYSLDVNPGDSYEFYHIREMDSGYIPIEATTISGTVRAADWIEYTAPLDGKTLTDNDFWGRWEFDLVIENLQADPNPAYPDEEVLLTAHISNTGPYTLENVPVEYAVDGVPFDTQIVGQIPPDVTVDAHATRVFSSTGLFEVRAAVNPDGALPELEPDNNTASVELEIFWEENPIWAMPDLALDELHFEPHRPAAGEDVTLMAKLSNSGGGERVQATLISLRVDDQIVDEGEVLGLDPGDVHNVSLTWHGATPGRHALELTVDPEDMVMEHNESNNRLDEWVRVEGAPSPLPDLEVEEIALEPPTPEVGDTVLITAEVCNEGYSDTAGLPVLISLDGYELARPIITLPQGACEIVAAEWPAIGEGAHVVDVWIDPDDVVDDDSVRARWGGTVVIPGAQYKYLAGSWTPWDFIGPDTINAGAYSGRIDAIDISEQDRRRMALGAPAGGVWTTDDGGGSWTAWGDYLPSPNFSVVAFDPTDDDIIYAATGSSLYGGGTGLYKSTDGGAHWTNFAGTWLGNGYAALLLRYTTPNTLTILAATDSGVWMWDGDKLSPKTALADWQRVWQQGDPGLTSKVTDMLITAETTPRLYIAVLKDSVYRAEAASPADAWTRLDTGLPTDLGVTKLGNSAADPDRVYAAIKRTGGQLEIYRRDYADTAWSYRGRPSDTYGNRNTYNAFIAPHPTAADVLYIGGVKGYRSSDGGSTFEYTIPAVHDDYKALKFDPSDASVVYFVSDGGIYSCTNNTGAMNCAGLNHKLGTTMFYDIALAATMSERTIGGTQDNGTIMGDGSTSWTNLSYGGDGRYVAIDPSDADTMFAEYQFLESVVRSTTAGKPWLAANNGLPSGGWADPFIMHPTDGQVLLAAADQVYRTTNAGGQWSPIGPGSALTAGNIERLAIDAANDRYYAGTSRGEIWTVAATQAATDTWSQIYTHTVHQAVRGIQVDPANANLVYVSFAGQGVRVVKLTHSGDWPSAWAAADITGNLPQQRRLYGPVYGHPQWDVVRGLLKDPTAEALYLSTDRGVYQGRPVGSGWQWYPDTCGLPLTYVSDLELHPDGDFVRASTYGRGAYERALPLAGLAPDAYDASTRNDTLATAATLTGTIVDNWFMPGLKVDGLNLDRLNDIDYFTIQLPLSTTVEGYAECEEGLDPKMCMQGQFQLVVHAPNTPDPLELRLYNADGSLFREYTSKSNLTYKVECPHDFFPGSVITFSVRSPGGCQSEYDLQFWYNRWFCEKDVPELFYDPPIVKRLMPELRSLSWMFPADSEAINRAFVGQAPELPEQRLIFHWDRRGDFLATFNIEGAGGLEATLYDAANNPLSDTGPLRHFLLHADAALTSTQQISVTGLEAGWYALDIGGGEFPTYFELTFNEAPYHIYLPLILRQSVE